MPKNYTCAPHMNGNLLCAIDFETTGADVDRHEIIQLAIVPLDDQFNPIKSLKPFYTTIAPMRPETADVGASAVHGLSIDDLILHSPSQDRAADMLVEWYDRLDLAFDRRIVPLAHNWAFECRFLFRWLGHEQTNRMFLSTARDPMVVATSHNDIAYLRGTRPPYDRVSNGWLCSHFGIENAHAHDALSDCYATAKVYRRLLQEDILL